MLTRFLSSLLAGGLLACCTPFGEAKPAGDDAALDGAASSDGATSADGSTPDAEEDAGASADEVVFSETFDPLGWETPWDPLPVAGANPPAVVPEQGRTQSALRIIVDPANNPRQSFLTRVSPLPLREITVLSGHMRVAAKGSGEVDLFGLRVKGSNEGVWVVHRSDTAWVVEAYETATMKSFGDVAASELGPVIWTRIELRVTRNPPALQWQVGASRGKTTLAPAFTSGALAVEIGASYVGPVTKLWTVYYDDVAVAVSR